MPLREVFSLILHRMLPDRTAVTAAVALALVLVVLLMGRPAVAAVHDKPDVVPIVECVIDHRDGSRTARLGWHNHTGREVTVDYGHDNNVTPGRRTHDLPRRFAAGRTPPSGVFTITFSRHEVLVWRLFGRAATSAGARACASARPTTTTAATTTTTTTAPEQLAATGKPPGGPTTAPPQTAAPPTTAAPATTAASPAAPVAASQLLTSKPVGFVVVDAVPSLLVGLLVLSVVATGATIWRRRTSL